jgi:hypothetical protein
MLTPSGRSDELKEDISALGFGQQRVAVSVGWRTKGPPPKHTESMEVKGLKDRKTSNLQRIPLQSGTRVKIRFSKPRGSYTQCCSEIRSGGRPWPCLNQR